MASAAPEVNAAKPAAKPAAKRGGGGPGFSRAARSVGSRGAQYVSASGARQTAFLLIVAILLARLVLTGQLKAFWAAMWTPTRPLGTALPAKVNAPPSHGGGGSAGSF